MGKEFKNRNQQHKNRKPFNKDFRGTQHNKRGGGGQRGRGGGRGGHGNNAGGNRQFQPQRKQDFIPKVSLKEEQVGITEFVANGPGFTGVVKARFSDFHVNEIDPSGKVLQLTDLKIPQPLDEGLSAEQLEAAKVELADVLKPELWTSIEALAQLKGADAAAAQPIELDVTVMDKDKRTQIHKVLKKLYEGKVVSSTVSKGEGDAEQKFIKILKPKGGRDQNRNRWTFPGDYVHFLVHKDNMDTSEVAVIIAGRLNLRPSQVNYCGTKDKRAKTTQKFCIKRRTPSQIVSAVNNVSNVRIGNFEFSSEVLKLGQLKGNRFRIALRHVTGENAAIESRLQEIKQHGFINYYGLQRFGNCAAIPTYEVGIALLKSDYKLACELILKPRDNDLHFMRAIREAWWKNRDSTAAAAMFRGDKFIEKKLLDGLSQYGESDYASALRKIPRNMLLLYPHAFQSLVFNRIASRRIKEFGLQVIEGDLVYRDKSEADTDHSAELDNIEDEAVATLDAEVGEAEKDEEVAKETEEVAKETEEVTKAADDTEESIFKRKVKPLTAADIASGEYTLFDVVLPLPGYDVRFPENVVGAWYEELLAEHGLSVEKLRHNVKTYAMAGAYRRMLIQPEQMSWQFCQYETPETTLIASDWETLKGKAVLGDVKEGKFKALLVDFCLPTSVYATMFLRELLKMDTSAASQTQLEQNEMQKHKDSAAAAEKRKAESSVDGEENGESGDAKKSKVDEEAKENEEAKEDEKNGEEKVDEEELEAKEAV